MDINITINDAALEARLDEYYSQAKIGDESFDVFCGRLILSQMIGWELQTKIQTQESAMRMSLQEAHKSLSEEGEKTIKGWTTLAMKTKLEAV